MCHAPEKTECHSFLVQSRGPRKPGTNSGSLETEEERPGCRWPAGTPMARGPGASGTDCAGGRGTGCGVSCYTRRPILRKHGHPRGFCHRLLLIQATVFQRTFLTVFNKETGVGLRGREKMDHVKSDSWSKKTLWLCYFV